MYPLGALQTLYSARVPVIYLMELLPLRCNYLHVSALLCVRIVSPHLRQQDQCIKVRLKLQRSFTDAKILSHVLLFD